MEGAYTYRKLRIGNRESGTENKEAGDKFLVPYFDKRLGFFKTENREQGIGNWELIPCSLFLVYTTYVSKVQIGNKNPVPGSILTIFAFIIV